MEKSFLTQKRLFVEKNEKQMLHFKQQEAAQKKKQTSIECGTTIINTIMEEGKL